MFGHTAVFHNATAAIYVYGGYERRTDRAALANSLYSLQLTKRAGLYDITWYRIVATGSGQVLQLH